MQRQQARVNFQDKRQACILFTEWILQDNLSFSSIGGDGFKLLVQFLLSIGEKYGSDIDIDHLIPHRSTISNYVKKVKSLHDQHEG
jgi:Hermes transposase DNA-binding domain